MRCNLCEKMEIARLLLCAFSFAPNILGSVQMKPMGIYSIALTCLLISGCASPVVTRLSSSGAGLAKTARFAILEVEPDGAPADAPLEDLLNKNLAMSGYTLASDGEYILSSAFGIRPGGIAIYGTPNLPPLSATQKKSGFGRCNVEVHRLTISVLERATGKSVYQGTAEETHCSAITANSLPYLTGALTSDLSKPGGNRVVKRKK
jgi:hypothetical protein